MRRVYIHILSDFPEDVRKFNWSIALAKNRVSCNWGDRSIIQIVGVSLRNFQPSEFFYQNVTVVFSLNILSELRTFIIIADWDSGAYCGYEKFWHFSLPPHTSTKKRTDTAIFHFGVFKVACNTVLEFAKPLKRIVFQSNARKICFSPPPLFFVLVSNIFVNYNKIL